MHKNATPQPAPKRPETEAGNTRVMRNHESEPRLPHERDESSDGQTGAPDERVEQAARDIEAGLKDTGRAPVMEKIAREHFPSSGSGGMTKH